METINKLTPIQILNAYGYSIKADALNHCTAKGVEYYIGFKGTEAAVIALMYNEELYFIDKPELRVMSETAREKGIETVTLFTNYGIELHSKYEKPEDIGFNKIVKLLQHDIERPTENAGLTAAPQPQPTNTVSRTQKKRIEYLVYGYKTKQDFESRNYEIIDEYIPKGYSKKIAKEELKSGKWYAVKWQSDDMEEIEIFYRDGEPQEVSRTQERTQGKFFIDSGDKPEETLLRIDSEGELFDVASFACDETENTTANAAYICKAVNNHESLLSALKRIVEDNKDELISQTAPFIEAKEAIHNATK